MRTKIIVILCIFVSHITGMQRDSLFTEAQKKAHEQQYQQALILCKLLIENDSSDMDALLLSGLVNKWMGDKTTATALFNDVIERTPKYKDAWLALISTQKGSSSACSTVIRACMQFPEDSTIASLQKELCVNSSMLSNVNVVKTSLRAGFETMNFEKSYNRKPWYSGAMELNVATNNWRFGSAVHAQQRDYSSLKVRAFEFEERLQRTIVQKVTGALIISLSPYRFTDTLYSKQSAAFEVYGGLPWKLECDGAIRLRDYGTMTTTTFVTGIGRYCKNYLLSGRLHTTLVSGNSYVNGGVEVRRFSLHDDNRFTSVAFFAGRSPFDGGAVVLSGYLTSAELKCTQSVPVARNIRLQPSMGFGGEQLVRMVPDALYLQETKIIGNIHYRIFITIGIQIGTED